MYIHNICDMGDEDERTEKRQNVHSWCHVKSMFMRNKQWVISNASVPQKTRQSNFHNLEKNLDQENFRSILNHLQCGSLKHIFNTPKASLLNIVPWLWKKKFTKWIQFSPRITELGQIVMLGYALDFFSPGLSCIRKYSRSSSNLYCCPFLLHCVEKILSGPRFRATQDELEDGLAGTTSCLEHHCELSNLMSQKKISSIRKVPKLPF